MDPMIGSALIGLGGAIGLDQRQYKQQQKFQKLQIKGQKEMGLFNQQLALDTWNKTNYEAQRKHMEKAGLNVGLMYGMGGSGGATTNTPTGNVTGGQPQDRTALLGMGMQMQLLKAQKENIEADTELKKAGTPAAGQTEELKTQEINVAKATAENIKTKTEQMKAETDNTKLQGQIMIFQKQLEQINVNIAKGTEASIIQQNNELAKKYKQEVRTLEYQNEITSKTKDYQIEQAKLAVTESNLRIKLGESGIEVNQAQITKMSMDLLNKQEELRQNNRALDQKDVQNLLQQWQTEFNIGTSHQGGIMNAAKAIDHLIPF